ncbi:MAG: TatD family hydrolase, partial [Treponemataceae bacterium]
DQIKELETQLNDARQRKIPICAIGECGIDLHWNENSLAQNELFEMQLELAKKNKLPIVVHSRKSFDQTLDCIKNIGHHKGVIHCYSYGKKEAVQFLDLGWHISFSGSITYGKKPHLEAKKDLISYIPQDLLLLETDSPYLCPQPHRGETNTSLFISHVYDLVAEYRNQSLSALKKTVYENTLRLFKNS